MVHPDGATGPEGGPADGARPGVAEAGRTREIEHADPLGSLDLNGAGDDPVDFVPTGGEDL
ncbi:Flowering time control protein FCA [Dorcoceras hygrometricum]|uniref:Flowering time control protein FCA n=1 Tax=Dorcoceras hygrometricum TaxID=472368 RepID=A0A2Z7AFK9_9LAMI|nr:Flowering time control protein FCA [Dorcoceras hygrometricum]